MKNSVSNFGMNGLIIKGTKNDVNKSLMLIALLIL